MLTGTLVREACASVSPAGGIIRGGGDCLEPVRELEMSDRSTDASVVAALACRPCHIVPPIRMRKLHYQRLRSNI